jgi:hypothetical protein
VIIPTENVEVHSRTILFPSILNSLWDKATTIFSRKTTIRAQPQPNTNRRAYQRRSQRKAAHSIILWISMNSSGRLPLRVNSSGHGNKQLKLIVVSLRLLSIPIQNSSLWKTVRLRYYLLGLFLNHLIMAASIIFSLISGRSVK